MKKSLNDYLTGPNGEQSSKRLFALILIVLFVVYFFSNLYWKFSLKQSLEDQLFELIVIFFAGITFEKLINGGWSRFNKKTGNDIDGAGK